MGSERKDGAGKSLDALVSAFRESPFAVFDPEKSSVGIFDTNRIVPAEIILISLSAIPHAVTNFFGYVNREISAFEYSDRDGDKTPLYRIQFDLAVNTPLADDRSEYKYRLARNGGSYLAYYTYDGMTARVLQMMPRLISDFYMKLNKEKEGKKTSFVGPVHKRKPRNPRYVPELV